MAAIPEGFHTITPQLVVDGAGRAIELYQRAFGATLIGRMDMPGTDKVMHAVLRIGTSTIFLSDPMPSMQARPPGREGSPVSFYCYMEDVDAAYRRAVDAGMKGTGEPSDMFWGDRIGNLEDPFGYRWMLATHVRDVTPEEMQRAAQSMGG
jgi:PhnB protein